MLPCAVEFKINAHASGAGVVGTSRPTPGPQPEGQLPLSRLIYTTETVQDRFAEATIGGGKSLPPGCRSVSNDARAWAESWQGFDL